MLAYLSLKLWLRIEERERVIVRLAQDFGLASLDHLPKEIERLWRVSLKLLKCDP